MNLSVCLITLNEEKVIERILSCAQKFADEIIVVDTGSIDTTVNICKKYTDKIYHFKWINDFSAARNYAFSKATCEYIMWLDADDFINNKNIDKILTIKNSNTRYDTYMCKYLCGFNDNDKPSLVFYRERIVKNCINARFKGVIHEVIIPFGIIQYTDVEIEHRKIGQGDPKRNLKIYRYHLNKEKFLQPRDLYYMAKEYYYLGYYKSAIIYLKRFIKERDIYLPDLSDAYLTLHDCYKNLGYKSPNKYLFEHLNKCGFNSEVFCKIGDEYLEKNQIKTAIGYYKFALNCEREEFGFVKPIYYYLYPNLQLVLCYYKLDDLKTARFYHEKCMLEDSKNKFVAYNNDFFNKLKM